MKSRGGLGREVREYFKSAFGIPDSGIPSDWLILTVFVNSGASSITERNAIWRWWRTLRPVTQNSNSKQTQRWVAFQTAKREEQRNCLKHAIDEVHSEMVNFPFNCCAFSLLELTICIETAFYRNERYLFVTWFIIFLSRTRWNHVLKP